MTFKVGDKVRLVVDLDDKTPKGTEGVVVDNLNERHPEVVFSYPYTVNFTTAADWPVEATEIEVVE
jgi:hypothetical protein